jgi:DNA-binding transcriptional LysR family regulator
VVIACAQSSHAGQAMTVERYAAAEHVAMRPPGSDFKAAEETLVNMNGLERNIATTSFSFSTLPHLIVGTDRLATVHGHLARAVKENVAIEIFPLPHENSPFRQMLQWHSYRRQDAGLIWLRSVFESAASSLT